jgi:hypothetical protein
MGTSIYHGAGLRGVGVSLVNCADELPSFLDEVIPRVARAAAHLTLRCT